MPFKEWSYLNYNSQYMGYFPVGMFLLGVTRWIHDNKSQFNHIHFIGRDGFLFQEAYSLLYGEKTNYVELSRKSMLPLSIYSPSDIYSMGKYLAWQKTTPRKVLNALKHIIDYETSLKERNLDTKFESEQSYLAFLKTISEKYYNEEKRLSYFRKMKDYFSSIFKENDVLFDVGYSGRSQIILSKFLGYPLHGMFLHINDDENLVLQKEMGIRILSFYDFTPSVTGSQREYLFSKQTGSLSEFKPTIDGIELIHEELDKSYADYYCIDEIQKNALKFVADFKKEFSDYFDILICRNIDISIPFEQFIHNCYNDLEIFSACIFEDELFDGRSQIILRDIWRSNIEYHYPLNAHHNLPPAPIESPVQTANGFWSLSKWNKAIIYFFCDFPTFKRKLKERFRRKKKK